MPGKYWSSIIDVAVDHGGYVTPSLVAPYGVPAVELRKMVSRGTLTTAARGVYRVPELPTVLLDEFILASLWAGERAVVSHASALLIHDLCDINPTKVHLTISPDYRISRSGLTNYAVHRAELSSNEVVDLDAIRLTTIKRTLHDSLDTVATYLVEQAIETATQRGAVNKEQSAILRKAVRNESQS